MSCDAVALSAFLLFAGADPSTPARLVPILSPAAPASVAGEPLFADIVKRAEALKTEVDGWKGKEGPLPGFDAFKAGIDELARLDMQAHVVLAERGSDGDLKCILRGISQDLPVRLKEVETAPDQRRRDMALKEMFWLLRDNVEVIVTPPSVTSGT